MATRVTRSVSGAALALLTITSIVGCAAESGTEERSSAEPADSITVWHSTADSDALLAVYDRFTEDTGIEIELVDIPSDNFEPTVLTKWATGDRPDILEYHAIQTWMLSLDPKNNMIDLSDEEFVGKSGSLYETAGSIDGNVYAAITSFPQVWGLYYNKNVFEEQGIELPTSFDDFENICSQLDGTGISALYQAGGTQWPMTAFSITYLGGEPDLNEWVADVTANEVAIDAPDSPFVEALERFKKLQNDECFNSDANTATVEQSMAAVLDGSTAMVLQHSNMLPRLLTAANDDQELIDENVGWLPVSSTGPMASFSPGPLGTYYAPKSGDPAKEAAALEFIRYTTGEAYQEYVDDSNTFPVLTGFEAPADTTPLLVDIKAAYDEGTNLSYESSIPGLGAINAEMSRLLNNEVDPKQAASNLQGQIRQAAQAAGLEGW